MNVISLQNIEKSYGTRLLFKEVNITFTTEKRLGLVGINGTGKSTFLKILAGQMEPDKGTIERNGKASIHYLAQTPEFDPDSTLLEAVLDGDHPRLRMVQSFERISREYREMQETGGEDAKVSRNYMNALEQMDQQDGWQVEQEARIILSKLGFPDVDQKVAMLSGGQKRRLALGQALLYPCDLLLLDEPTNDLDIPTLEVLEDFLDSFSGVIITVCHDRYFLDRVVDKLFVFTGDGHIEIVHGSYSDYKDALDESSGSKRPFYMPNDNIPANSKVVRAVEGGEADSDDSVDNQSNRVDTLGNDNVVAGDKTDTFKEIPKKGLNKAEEAEYAKIMDELPKLEHLVKGLDVMISQVATDYEKMQSLMEEREETQAQIDALTERWMELEERL